MAMNFIYRNSKHSIEYAVKMQLAGLFTLIVL